MQGKQVIAGFCLAAASVMVCAAAVEAPLSSPAAVEQRVRAWQPTDQERRWEKIGWAKDIRDALWLAKIANRPVFLFTLDGRMSVGRC